MKVFRALTRIYVENLDSAVEFYEKLLGVKCDLRFLYSEVGLELASVGQFLLLCGSAEALKTFRDTQTTLIVDSVDEFKKFLERNETKIIRGPKIVPTGKNMTVKHPDGAIVEYVEHKK